jgi:hypothetical protein
LVTYLANLARPIVSRSAGFHRHLARCDPSEEAQNAITGQFAAERCLSIRSRGMNLEPTLGNIQPDPANLVHVDVSSFCRSKLFGTCGTMMPYEGPSTPSNQL